VRVISVAGQLTDHYNPLTKQWISARQSTIKGMPLRQLAAHGHAVQHAVGYQWLTMRSKLVPLYVASSLYMQW
jgi:Zn-dependent membrane protease YugP